MKNNAYATLFLTAAVFFVIVFFVFSFSFAFAEEVTPSVATQTLIPGTVSCETPLVSSLNTYVYEGSLHSFEFVISDAAQVALTASVGKTEIPFQYMSRENLPDGSVKMRVNMSSARIGTSLPVSVTMLSAGNVGESVCVTTVSFALAGSMASVSDNATEEVAQTGGESTITWGSKTIGNIFSSLVKDKGSQADGVDSEPEDVEENADGVKKDGTGEEKVGWGSGFSAFTKGERDSILQKTGMVAAAKDAVTRVCTTGEGASRTWMVLLALYVVGAIALSARRERLFDDPMLMNAVLIAPFLALLAFWYFLPECRVGWWTLMGSAIVAVAAVFGKFYWKTFVNKKSNPWTAFHP